MTRHPKHDGPASSGGAEARFARLYGDHARDVLAYALRRVPAPEDAADVVAETFLVAWRRAGDVPPGDEARLWLYGVARRMLANQQRGERRRTRLADRLRTELPAAVALTQSPPGRDGAGAVAALAQLRDEDREVLLLTAWEELSPGEIADVLAISNVAVRSRLHRARRRLREALKGEANATGPRRAPGLEFEETR